MNLRLLNVALRGLVACSRFALVFFIAKYLGPEDLGLFGLILATVSFGSLLLGGDFYTYTQRKMLEMESSKWAFVVQHQFLAVALFYLIIIPSFLPVFFNGVLPWEYLFAFYSLLVAEHIALEIVRLLTVMQHQLLASWVLLVQRASWIAILIPLLHIYPDFRSLDSVLVAWLAGALSSVIFGAFCVARSVPKWRIFQFDTSWILMGFKTCLVFLLATLCSRGLLTFDRYVLESIASPAELGVYTFYIGVVLSVVGFLEPAIYSFLYPRMLQNYSSNRTLYNKAFRELIWSTVLASVILLTATWLLMPAIISWLGRPIYSQHTAVFEILLAAALLSALAMIPHYALYSMKMDRWIVYPQLMAFILFFVLVKCIDVQSGLVAVSLSLLLSLMCVFVLKTVGVAFGRRPSLTIN